jgi:hypothetical protein
MLYPISCVLWLSQSTFIGVLLPATMLSRAPSSRSAPLSPSSRTSEGSYSNVGACYRLLYSDIHEAHRGSSRDAAHLLRDIVAIHGEYAGTARDVSVTTERDDLPELVGVLAQHRAQVADRRRKNYAKWQEQMRTTATSGNERRREHRITRKSNPDKGIEL